MSFDFGPLFSIVPDGGVEFINKHNAYLSTSFEVHQALRTLSSSWKKRFSFSPKDKVRHFLRVPLQQILEFVPPESTFKLTLKQQCLHQTSSATLWDFFLLTPQVPVDSVTNVAKGKNRTGTYHNCAQLLCQSNYQKLFSNTFLSRLLLEPMPEWITAAKTASLKIRSENFNCFYASVRSNLLNKDRL